MRSQVVFDLRDKFRTGLARCKCVPSLYNPWRNCDETLGRPAVLWRRDMYKMSATRWDRCNLENERTTEITFVVFVLRDLIYAAVPLRDELD